MAPSDPDEFLSVRHPPERTRVSSGSTTAATAGVNDRPPPALHPCTDRRPTAPSTEPAPYVSHRA